MFSAASVGRWIKTPVEWWWDQYGQSWENLSDHLGLGYFPNFPGPESHESCVKIPDVQIPTLEILFLVACSGVQKFILLIRTPGDFDN